MQEKLKEHGKLIRRVKRSLKKLNSGKDVRVIEVKPIPDILLVDFENKQIFAVEVSKVRQLKQKAPLYRKSDFKKVLFFQVKKDGFSVRKL